MLEEQVQLMQQMYAKPQIKANPNISEVWFSPISWLEESLHYKNVGKDTLKTCILYFMIAVHTGTTPLESNLAIWTEET